MVEPSKVYYCYCLRTTVLLSLLNNSRDATVNALFTYGYCQAYTQDCPTVSVLLLVVSLYR